MGNTCLQTEQYSLFNGAVNTKPIPKVLYIVSEDIPDISSDEIRSVSTEMKKKTLRRKRGS